MVDVGGSIPEYSPIQLITLRSTFIMHLLCSNVLNDLFSGFSWPQFETKVSAHALDASSQSPIFINLVKPQTLHLGSKMLARILVTPFVLHADLYIKAVWVLIVWLLNEY